MNPAMSAELFKDMEPMKSNPDRDEVLIRAFYSVEPRELYPREYDNLIKYFSEVIEWKRR